MVAPVRYQSRKSPKLAKFRSWRDVTGCQRGSPRGTLRSHCATRGPPGTRSTSRYVDADACRLSRAFLPPAMTRDRENPGRARAPCRDRSRDASLLFFGGVKHHGRARLARRRLDARAPCPCGLAGKSAGLARSRAAGRPRGPIRRARGRDTCHDHYPTLRWTLVFSSPFLHRPRARETRDAPSTAEARLARRRRVPCVSRAIPRRPPHRHPVADRSHPRAPLPRPRCQLSRPRGSSGVSRRIAIRNASRAREACLGIFPTHEKEKAGCLLALAELAARRVALQELVRGAK